MFKSVVAAVLVAGGVLALSAPAAAGFQTDALDQLLSKADEIYAERGFAATGWVKRGGLAKGGEERLTLNLEPGKAYSVVGMCDTDCEDLDFHLVDASGAVVDTDTADDDFPIVGTAPKSAGAYTLRVVMKACGAARCSYAAKAFAK